MTTTWRTAPVAGRPAPATRLLTPPRPAPKLPAMTGPLRGPGPPPAAPEFATLALDRRRFLVLLGGAAAWTTLSPTLGWAQRLDRVPLQSWTLPESTPASAIEQTRALIAAAILAPSHWNAQPWRFELDGDVLRVVLDAARTLPASDPDQRLAHVSLGAALENLLVAARAWGLQPVAQHLPWGLSERRGAPLVAATVRWHAGGARRDRVLFGALAERRSNPREFEGRAIQPQSRAQMLAQVFEGVGIRWIDDRTAIRRVADLCHEASLATSADRRIAEERARWMRGDDGDARRRGDGVALERLGVDGVARWLAGRSQRPGAWLHGWAASSVAREVRERVRSSGALLLITTRPREGDARWLLAGQSYERLALKAATLGIAQQPLTGPIESARHREALLARFGATADEEPVLLVRLGHAKPVDPTPRRALALVSTYRNS